MPRSSPSSTRLASTLGRNETMHHRHVGDDPHWVSYWQRERLEFTDPPVAPPRPHHRALRGLHALIAALAIIAVVGTDTTPVPPTDLGAHGDPTLSPHTKEALP